MPRGDHPFETAALDELERGADEAEGEPERNERGDREAQDGPRERCRIAFVRLELKRDDRKAECEEDNEIEDEGESRTNLAAQREEERSNGAQGRSIEE